MTLCRSSSATDAHEVSWVFDFWCRSFLYPSLSRWSSRSAAFVACWRPPGRRLAARRLPGSHAALPLQCLHPSARNWGNAHAMDPGANLFEMRRLSPSLTALARSYLKYLALESDDCLVRGSSAGWFPANGPMNWSRNVGWQTSPALDSESFDEIWAESLRFFWSSGMAGRSVFRVLFLSWQLSWLGHPQKHVKPVVLAVPREHVPGTMCQRLGLPGPTSNLPSEASDCANCSDQTRRVTLRLEFKSDPI